MGEADPSLPHLAAREGWSYVALDGPRMIHAIAWRDFSELTPRENGSRGPPAAAMKCTGPDSSSGATPEGANTGMFIRPRLAAEPLVGAVGFKGSMARYTQRHEPRPRFVAPRTSSCTPTQLAPIAARRKWAKAPGNRARMIQPMRAGDLPSAGARKRGGRAPLVQHERHAARDDHRHAERRHPVGKMAEDGPPVQRRPDHVQVREGRHE